MSLMDRAKKAGSIKSAAILADSAFFNNKDTVPTELPILNGAFSGDLDGGLVSGVTILAGESKSFKSLLGLYCMKAYMDKYPDAIALFYDSEFGITPEYLKMNGIDTERVLHIPIEHIEMLKFDLVQRLKEFERGDKVFIFIDSLGLLGSKKEIEDAEEGKSVADMTRAKAIRSFFRVVTSTLTVKDLSCVVINHVYKTFEMFQKDVISGGCLQAGTKIYKADGTLCNIELIKVGDFVKTLQGSKEVTHTWTPDTLLEGNPECYEVTFEDGTTIVCSAEHKFLVAGEWQEIQNISEDIEVDIITE